MSTIVKTFGVDEAGRGPLAGPVAVAVFGTKVGYKMKGFPKGKDSKKMTEKEREKWFAVFSDEKKKGNVFFEVAFSSAKVIDGKGIVFAIRSAMETCLQKLEQAGIASGDSRLLLDGALSAPPRFSHQKTIIKGDEKETLIACASIVAKVSRDHLMKKLSKKYPEYHLEINKGYGTVVHRKTIATYGFSPIHRKTFCKNVLIKNRNK